MIPDEFWVEKAVNGDSVAFEELVKRYHTKIYRLAYRILDNPDDADDATQEAFVEAYKSLKSFEGRSKFYTWLYKVAKNTCHQHVRKAESRQRTLSSFAEDFKYNYNESNVETPERIVLKNERNHLIQEAVSKLPAKQREVVVLFYMHNLKYREIAEILNCSEGTVASRLHTALRNLKPKLKNL